MFAETICSLKRYRVTPDSGASSIDTCCRFVPTSDELEPYESRGYTVLIRIPLIDRSPLIDNFLIEFLTCWIEVSGLGL